MEPSREIRDLVLGIYHDMSTGDLSALDDLFTDSPDAAAFGTDPQEFWTGGPEIKAMHRQQVSEMATDGQIRITPGDLHAFVEGDLGWGYDLATLILADGSTLHVRNTFVCRREEDGKWRMVHVHSSVGAPNLETWGREFTTSIEAVLRSVEHTQPDLSGMSSAEGTVTLAFTDIEGSTRLNSELGDHAWRDVLLAHIELVTKATSSHDGIVVDRAGDGFMLAFGEAPRAARCLAALQRDLAAEDARVRVRMGIHTGEPLRAAGAFFGRDVAYAARVASVARGQEILASSATKSSLEHLADLRWEAPREESFKGFDEPQKVYPLVWHRAHQ